MGSGSFILDTSERRVGPDLKKTLMLNFLQTLRILSLTPATYGMVSDCVLSFSSLSSDSSAGRVAAAFCVAGIVHNLTECMKHDWQPFILKTAIGGLPPSNPPSAW